MQTGAEEYFSLARWICGSGSQRNAIVERGQVEWRASDRSESASFVGRQVEGGGGSSENAPGEQTVYRCSKRMVRLHNHAMGLNNVRRSGPERHPCRGHCDEVPAEVHMDDVRTSQSVANR